MKTKLFTIIAVIGMLILGLASCSELDEIGHTLFNADEVYVVDGKPDTDMACVMLTTYDAKYDKDAGSVTRARVHLLVSGYHEKPYGFTYTIDGKPGTGDLAMYRLANGEDYTGLLTLKFDGNCPSGEPLDLKCYRVNNRTMQYHGGTDFLLPLLEPGTHTFTATIGNEYGQSITETRTFLVEGED